MIFQMPFPHNFTAPFAILHYLDYFFQPGPVFWRLIRHPAYCNSLVMGLSMVHYSKYMAVGHYIKIMVYNFCIVCQFKVPYYFVIPAYFLQPSIRAAKAKGWKVGIKHTCYNGAIILQISVERIVTSFPLMHYITPPVKQVNIRRIGYGKYYITIGKPFTIHF